MRGENSRAEATLEGRGEVEIKERERGGQDKSRETKREGEEGREEERR